MKFQEGFWEDSLEKVTPEHRFAKREEVYDAEIRRVGFKKMNSLNKGKEQRLEWLRQREKGNHRA